jgi:hypothetical protein
LKPLQGIADEAWYAWCFWVMMILLSVAFAGLLMARMYMMPDDSCADGKPCITQPATVAHRLMALINALME